MNECTANGGVVCDPNALIASNPLVNMRPVYNFPYPSQNTFFWTNANCTQMVKVRQDGMMCVAMCKLLVSRLLYFSYSTFVRFFNLQSDHSQTSVSHVIMFCSNNVQIMQSLIIIVIDTFGYLCLFRENPYFFDST